MNVRLVCIGWFVTILLVCFSLLPASAANPNEATPAVVEEAPASPWSDAELTFGLQARDSETEGTGDLLIPVWNPGGTGLLFVNPRTAITDHDGEEGNLGVGYRQLCEKYNIIFGANAYYDYRDTGYSHYDQWGVGVELLSPWVDFRANYYEPDDKLVLVSSQTESESRTTSRIDESWTAPYVTGSSIAQDYTRTHTLTTLTTTHTYEQFEQALGGYDWEVGVRLPLPTKLESLEPRIFAGYYDFDNDFDGEAKGWKARAELRVLSSIFLEAGLYENDDLTGSDWFAGFRLSVPLCSNPFATSKSRGNADTRDLSARLTEMVMRDPQVRLDTSKFIANATLEEQTTTSSRSTQSEYLTVMDDIQFVDGDVETSGDGSGERPFATIQEGADNVSGNRNVYVFDATSAYAENVVLPDGTTLWGSGVLMPAFNGQFFGSGVAPVVDGMSMGPSITMANLTTVKGFTIKNTDTGGSVIMDVLPSLGATDISRIGILGNDAADLTITDNTLAGNYVGALLTRQGDFNMTFIDNLVQDNDLSGLEVNATGASGTFNVLLQNSLFQNNGGDGANIIGDTYDTSIIQVLNSQFNANSDGLSIDQFNTDLTIATVSGSTGSDNLGMGLGIAQRFGEVSLANISGSTANNNGTEGIFLGQISDEISIGIIGLPEGLGSSVSALTDEFGLSLPPDVATLLSAEGPVTANNNGDTGVCSLNGSRFGLSLGAFFDITATGNANDGLTAEVINIDGIAASIGGSSQNWSDILQLVDDVVDPAFGVDLPLSITGDGQMQLNNNGDMGMRIVTRGDDASISAFAGLEAIGNVGSGAVMYNVSDGISVSALAHANLSGNMSDGLFSKTIGADVAIGILADLTASNNGGSGILTDTGSSDGIAALLTLSTDAIRPLGALLGDMLIGAPIEIPGSAYGPVVASGNAGDGIMAIVDGNDMALTALLDTQTDSNGGNGINLALNSDNGTAISAILSSDLLYNVLGDLVTPPISYDPIGRVSASGNTGAGVVLTQFADGDAYSILAGIDADLNGAQGIYADITSVNSDAVAILVNADTDDNVTRGTELTLTAFDDAISALIQTDSRGNGDQGFHIEQTAANGDALFLMADGVDAYGNGGTGLHLDLTTADDAVACISDAWFEGNNGQGARIIADAGDNVVLLAGDHALDLFESNYSGGLAGDLFDLFGSEITQDVNVFSHNANVGLMADLTSANGNVWVSMDGNEANDNGGDAGLLLNLTAVNSSIYTSIMNTEASDNDSLGIRLSLAGTGLGEEALVGLEDITTQGNGATGIYVDEAFNGSVEIVGESLTSTGNTGNGVSVITDAAGAVIDFGGGVLGSLGQSSFYGNGNPDFSNNGVSSIVAQENWWGADADPVVAGQTAGAVDADPWLSSEPNP